MLVTSSQLFLAYIADLVFGDPPWLPHPVRLFGLVTVVMETVCRKVAPSPQAPRMAGVLTTLTISSGAGLGAWLLLKWITESSPFAASAVTIYLAYTTLSVRGLDRAGREVLAHLESGRLKSARSALAMMVGRDTRTLDEPEIVRAVIETVAENTSDGVVAPMLYLALGGVPAALAYKAINTLDSMIGYKNDCYFYFGWAAALLDDLVNLVPARLTALGVIAAAAILRLSWRESWRIVGRDARSQPSPNSGFPEAAYAGALGIRLGGSSVYSSQLVRKAYLGDAVRELKPSLYPKVRCLLYLTSALILLASLGLIALCRTLLWR
ncbi:MAG TPA: adenosylcobinamide-phosphate synthase CbiB [Terriglobia bacterium]|nr:adenosylcobinamide-phosphate synthase CbiB [Terriglobia bacterium]